ncbi:cholesterol oxidase [Catenuloplanes nepalensis]|uniref:Cholesterol oxidase n=1 Tax=Catenuloplanes nepalensis TaxID=587533 RepID=A0ABT9MT76_9ACTN|nr:GMC oxidoreductase [Catenuloplanes nepalensis]MDP9794649.1 cholesterol oxidase [Catenuloplanes nepalensis]
MPSAHEHVDVVVVGSGFGGSVAAYRFAEAGLGTVLLERGRAYAPGEFPRTPAEMARNLWDPGAGLHGLFDVWSFTGIDAIVSSGLGGGSLIYANVLLRKDEAWFVRDQALPGGGVEDWPLTRADLDPHYDRVERMIGPVPYPLDRKPFDRTAKTRAMAEAADRLGLDLRLPPLAVSFASRPGGVPGPGLAIEDPAYGNLHGVPRLTCRLCGECDIGCNDGAKNSLDHTYLSAAKDQGADLRVRHEVRTIAARDHGGYEVRYVIHDDSPPDRLPVHVITCDRLVLAAGTLGTSWLLLRDRDRLPGISPTLGTRFSGNGDLLGFVLRAVTPDGRPRPLRGSHGPVITSAIRVPDEADGGTGRGHYVEDAGYPGFLDWLVEATQWHGLSRRALLFALSRAQNRLTGGGRTAIAAELAALFGDVELSESSLPLLGMGRDIPDGRLSVRRGRLAADWTTQTSRRYFEEVRATMRAVATVLGGEFQGNPLGAMQQVVTVHPLGGAPMADRPERGVTDAYGEVFGLPGLYVADGAALPGPVGPNPALTIAAHADRLADRALCTPPRRPAFVFAPPTRLSFTEEMTGFCTVRLTIEVDDVFRFVADPDHEARATGTIDHPLLGRHAITGGTFRLFPDEGGVTRHMRYRLPFGTLCLIGHKDVRDDPGLDLWPDTTTLHARIVGLPDGEPIDEGEISIGRAAFLEQLTTVRVTGPRRAAALAAFGRLFAGTLWDVYAGQSA